MRSVIRDARYGVRTLTKVPGFCAVIVLTIALGIGANTAMFSIVNATLLELLPYREPERLDPVRGTDGLAGPGVGRSDTPTATPRNCRF